MRKDLKKLVTLGRTNNLQGVIQSRKDELVTLSGQWTWKRPPCL